MAAGMTVLPVEPRPRAVEPKGALAYSPPMSGAAHRSWRRRRARAAVLAAAVAVLAAGCVRSGPPAPLVDHSGIYYTAPARAPATGRDGPTRPPAGRTERRRAAPAAEVAPLPATGTLTTRGAATLRVGRGETLFSIARREKVPIRALIEANGLKPPYHLRAGQTLRVPAVRVYVVARGDTVYGIARRFDVGKADIIRENGLAPPDYGLVVGQQVVLPWEPRAPAVAARADPAAEAAAPARPAVAAPKPSPSPKPQTPEPPPPPSVATAARPAPPPEPPPPAPPRSAGVRALAPADPPARAGKTFLWPVRGTVVSGFGAKGGGLYNEGINIAAREGEIVRAAENGVVAYAGNELRGYGNLLLIRHAGGWVSAYAHNGALLVSRGQTVHRGQPIARVGRTGAVARPQLHFELRRGRQAVDPTRYLGDPTA